ncbi:ATP-dependent helicase HrpB [Alteromonadaceae bacterium M269]|nr:ATP-dependent helicase HrpB [Alteromonadaceae bacterium M269]
MSTSLSLPVANVADELISNLRTSNAVLIAPPGAGKSTYLPLKLINSDLFSHKKIVMLQPRRLAARNIASYLASQLGESVGETIGYRIRGESRVSPKTRLEIVTEGVLTRMLQNDPELSDVGLVVFDEFHERNLHADFSLALCLESQQAFREGLRLLVMSATLAVDGLTDYLNEAELVECEGRQFPIDVRYLPQKHQTNQALLSSLSNLTQQVLEQEQGNILIFLPTTRLIKGLVDLLDEGLDDKEYGIVHICPLYGDLSLAQQTKAIDPTGEGERKVVVATNIAETSLTIEGIRIVIDSGLENRASFNLTRGITQVESVRIAKASATQRAGRAGRLEAGVVYRLWSEEQHARLAENVVPQIRSTDITPFILDALVWGSSLESLPLLDKPSEAQIKQGTSILQNLRAIDDAMALTTHGRNMHALGCHPRIANMLLSASKVASEEDESVDRVQSLACILAALLEGKDPLHKSGNSDIYLRLQYLQKNKKHSLWQDARHWAKRLKASLTLEWPLDLIPVLVAHAYPDHIAKLRNQTAYQLSCGSGAMLADGDSLSASSWLAVGKLMLFKDSANASISLAAGISLVQLETHFSYLFEEKSDCLWQESSQRIEARELTAFGRITVSKKPCSASTQEIEQVWRQKLSTMSFEELPLSDKAKSWVNRVKMAQHYSDSELWPDFSDAGLMEQIDEWLLPYLSEVVTWSAFQKLDWEAMLKPLLSYDLQQRIISLLPESIELPSGRNAKLDYVGLDKVVLSVRMQEMYGLSSHPAIADNKLPIVIELLSPRQTPIQITQDLPGFWSSSYQQVRKDMKSQYPKHFWPEDPSVAEASLKTNRQLRAQGKSTE